jgi:hypothetical protein
MKITTAPRYRDAGGDTSPALKKLQELFNALLVHDGFGEIKVEMRILKRGQKEVILHCGKQYRFVLDVPGGCLGANHKKGGVP